ncbi:hypothetical protein J7I98_29305 [Streptomyces sp. ISL-98]|uniref:hypothetical protein n=1 Tax=Streptomyces sp. ISL-98 TaxID=2819192 RepID=UPI001BE68E23|nr:hypothetical protein [Streptomyces sp. ISL-98]MBT2509888.1 hypothetical protein [Streptomyces sp. ISL-98]
MTSWKQRRVHIPVVCWVPKPGTPMRCTLRAGHSGDHFRAYSREAWPKRAGETQ